MENSAVKNILYNYVECRKHRGKLGEQKIANSPSCRLNESSSFAIYGIDMFGSFVVR